MESEKFNAAEALKDWNPAAESESRRISMPYAISSRERVNTFITMNAIGKEFKKAVDYSDDGEVVEMYISKEQLEWVQANIESII